MRLSRVIAKRESKYQIKNATKRVVAGGIKKDTTREIVGTVSFLFTFRILRQRRSVFISLKCKINQPL